jgi:PAS domain S-box-containing protein
MDELSDGIFVADDAGRYIEVNHRACELLGRTREELLRLNVADVIARDDLADRPLALAAISVGKSKLSERKLVRGDGTRFVAEISATRLSATRFLSIVRDITARKQAAEVARRAEENFRALLDVLPDAVVVHRGGKVVYANATAARNMGRERPEDLIGIPVLDAVHPDDRAIVRERVATMMRTGEPAGLQRERFMRPDGTHFDAEVVALPLRFDGQAALLAVARDVSERERLQVQLAQSERLASVGLLAAGVAHEINNPLAYALLNLERVLEDLGASPATPEVVRGRVRDAIDGARRVQRIVRDLRTFARGVSDEVSLVDIGAVTRDALHLVINELRFRARVVTDLGAVPPVRANADRLVQVFVNLLLNAAHAIPEGRADAHEVRVTARAEGGFVRAEVTDTGTGIAPEHLSRLFDPFFTTRPPGMGTGLGLAICHSIVASFGGRLEVKSQLGSGSAFTVILPASEGSVEAPKRSIPAGVVVEAPPVATARRKLLLVEDERNLRFVLQTLLGAHYDVTATATGREAQERLSADGDWHLVLCDLLMPEVSGMDLHEWVVAHRPSLADRMVFMTGGAFTERARELLARHPGRWIEKPFEFDALVELLARVGG